MVAFAVLALAIPVGLQYVRRLAGPGPWPPAPRSGVEVIDIDSTALGHAMPALVWTPAGTTSEARLPLVVLFHGQGGDPSAWFHAIGADLEAADLIAQGRIPPVLLVSAGIANSMGIDSEPTDDGYDHGAYGTYLADELIPAIVERYPVSTDPRDHFAAGLSMGGYAALHLAFRHPARFGGVGGLSPAVALDIQPQRAWLYRDEVDRDTNDPQRLATTATLDEMRVYLGYGTTDYAWIIDGTRVLADRLATTGCPRPPRRAPSERPRRRDLEGAHRADAGVDPDPEGLTPGHTVPVPPGHVGRQVRWHTVRSGPTRSRSGRFVVRSS